MIARDNIDRLAGGNANVVDSEGNKIGSLGELYLDDTTDQPNWATVKTGLFGMSESFVPLAEATLDGDDIRVPYTKDQVKDAPRIEPDGHLEVDQEDRLYSYYGLSGTGTAGYNTEGFAGTGRMAGTEGYETVTETTGTAADRDLAGEGIRETDYDRDRAGRDTDDTLTRSEERLRVGTESRETGRARLRKYVVTENVTRTVPVQREEVRIEREPITDAGRSGGLRDTDLGEDEVEVTLHSEEPVVEKETVPVERVRLDTETVTGQETVSEDVRKERIETDGDDLDRRDRD
jgi:uncharacterized protein (TIGR02271 family)